MSTRIEWVINPDGETQGKTWNPVTGCTPCSPGCTHCYARRMAQRLAGRHGYPEAPHHFDVTLRPDRLDEPLQRKKPTTYFVCSMSDLFHEDVPRDFIVRVWSVMLAAKQHRFQVLTKRPARAMKLLNQVLFPYDVCSTGHLDWPLPNVHLGVTAENQATADERIPLLLQIPAAVRFVSVEPMLGPVDLWIWKKGLLGWNGLDWVICGAETGPGARPVHPDWARSLRDQCVAAGVPFFFKSWGEWFPRSQWEDNPHLILPDDCDCANGHNLKILDGDIMHRVGKKAAGRLLDGRTWDELPR